MDGVGKKGMLKITFAEFPLKEWQRRSWFCLVKIRLLVSSITFIAVECPD